MVRSDTELRDRMFDSDYFPYTKFFFFFFKFIYFSFRLKRVGNSIATFVSDDAVFWSEYASYTFTVPLPTVKNLFLI